MNRRGMIGVATALVLALFTGASASFAETKAKSACVAVEMLAPAEACTCDVNAKAGQACDCCGDATCCTLESVTSDQAKVENSGKVNESAKVKSACDCCGAACACEACTCEVNAKAGEACDCCKGAACCSTTHVTSDQSKVENSGKVNGSAKVKAACDCCGSACVCETCTCDINAKAGEACDCCKGAACCSTESAASAKVKAKKLAGMACCSIKAKNVAPAAAS